MLRALGVIFLLLAFVGSAHGEVRGETVDYKAGNTTMKGYLAYDDAFQGKRPGILVVHEWWGLNDYARRRARMLAELGYTALAVDMYGEGRTATHPDDASKFATAVREHMDVARQRFLAAKKVLQDFRYTDPTRIGAIGYCFGGGVVLQMAREGVDLDGVVSFHGSLATKSPAKPGQVKAKILVLTGGDDPFNPPEEVEKFRKEMEAAHADFRIVVYPGAKHSFTNPDATEYGKKFNLPIAYDPDADRKSWAEMREFFKKVFAR